MSTRTARRTIQLAQILQSTRYPRIDSTLHFRALVDEIGCAITKETPRRRNGRWVAVAFDLGTTQRRRTLDVVVVNKRRAHVVRSVACPDATIPVLQTILKESVELIKKHGGEVCCMVCENAANVEGAVRATMDEIFRVLVVACACHVLNLWCGAFLEAPDIQNVVAMLGNLPDSVSLPRACETGEHALLLSVSDSFKSQFTRLFSPRSFKGRSVVMWLTACAVVFFLCATGLGSVLQCTLVGQTVATSSSIDDTCTTVLLTSCVVQGVTTLTVNITTMFSTSITAPSINITIASLNLLGPGVLVFDSRGAAEGVGPEVNILIEDLKATNGGLAFLGTFPPRTVIRVNRSSMTSDSVGNSAKMPLWDRRDGTNPKQALFANFSLREASSFIFANAVQTMLFGISGFPLYFTDDISVEDNSLFVLRNLTVRSAASNALFLSYATIHVDDGSDFLVLDSSFRSEGRAGLYAYESPVTVSHRSSLVFDNSAFSTIDGSTYGFIALASSPVEVMYESRWVIRRSNFTSPGAAFFASVVKFSHKSQWVIDRSSVQGGTNIAFEVSYGTLRFLNRSGWVLTFSMFRTSGGSAITVNAPFEMRDESYWIFTGNTLNTSLAEPMIFLQNGNVISLEGDSWVLWASNAMDSGGDDACVEFSGLISLQAGSVMSLVDNNCSNSSALLRRSGGGNALLGTSAGIFYNRCSKLNDSESTAGMPFGFVSAGICGTCNSSAECFPPRTVLNSTCTANATAQTASCACFGSGEGNLCLPLGAEVPSTAVPSTAVPSTAVPSTAVPSTAVPSTAVPSTAVPSTAVPSTEVPSTAVPSTAVPSTAAPSTAVPSTEVPSTAVPSTAVPSTAIPSTAVPSTAVPSTAVPSTAVPSTAVPSAVPSTEVPSTAVLSTAAPTTTALTTILTAAPSLVTCLLPTEAFNVGLQLSLVNGTGQTLAIAGPQESIPWAALLAPGAVALTIFTPKPGIIPQVADRRLALASARAFPFGNVTDVYSTSASSGTAMSIIVATAFPSLPAQSSLPTETGFSWIVTITSGIDISGPNLCLSAGGRTSNATLTAAWRVAPLDRRPQLQDAVQTAFRSSTAASAALGNPMTTLSCTTMVSLGTLRRCVFSDVEQLDPSINPLSVAVGATLGKYYRGAVVAGLSVAGGSALLAAIATQVLEIALRQRGVDGKEFVRFPSILILPFSVVHQGMVTSGTSLIRVGRDVNPSTTDVVLGLMGILIPLAVTVFATYATALWLPCTIKEEELSKYPPLRYEAYVPGLQRLIRISKWQQIWADNPEALGFRVRYKFIIDGMAVPWWIAAELSSGLVQGIIIGIRRSEEEWCRNQLILLVAHSSCMLLAVAYWRPCGAPLGNFFLCLSKLGAALAVSFQLFSFETASSEDAAEKVTATFAFLSSLDTTLQVIVAVVLKLRELLAGRLSENHRNPLKYQRKTSEAVVVHTDQSVLHLQQQPDAPVCTAESLQISIEMKSLGETAKVRGLLADDGMTDLERAMKSNEQLAAADSDASLLVGMTTHPPLQDSTISRPSGSAQLRAAVKAQEDPFASSDDDL
jgi:hypothetical protein